MKRLFCLIFALLLLAACGGNAVLPEGESEDDAFSTDPYGNRVEMTPAILVEPFPCIAALPEENLYFYGIHDAGVVLYNGKKYDPESDDSDTPKGKYFDWPWFTPGLWEPQVDYFDFDGDGKKELLYCFSAGAGTGAFSTELRFVEIIEERYGYEDEYVDYKYKETAFNDASWEKLVPKMSGVLSDNKKNLDITFEGKTYTIKDINWMSEWELEYVGQACIYRFTIENDHSISAEVGIAAGGPPLNYVAKATAKVIYDGKNITFTDWEITDIERN